MAEEPLYAQEFAGLQHRGSKLLIETVVARCLKDPKRRGLAGGKLKFQIKRGDEFLPSRTEMRICAWVTDQQ